MDCLLVPSNNIFLENVVRLFELNTYAEARRKRLGFPIFFVADIGFKRPTSDL